MYKCFQSYVYYQRKGLSEKKDLINKKILKKDFEFFVSSIVNLAWTPDLKMQYGHF